MFFRVIIERQYKFQLVDISKFDLNSKIKKFSYSFICGKGILPPSGGRIAFCLQSANLKASVFIFRRDCAAHLFCQQLCDRQLPLQIIKAAECGTIQCPAQFRSLAHLHFLISKIFSCKLCKNRPACAPSIWVW